MSNFIEYIEKLKDDLTDIIIYLENSGKIDELMYQTLEELDDKDPFVKVNASITAQVLVTKNKVLH